MKKHCLKLAAAAIFLIQTSWIAAGNEFPLKDGDTWVFAGDSITAQRLHTNYFEAFCVTRFPNWSLHFRNSGVGGDTIPRVLARFDWDVAAWKPTVVSIELGMNDSGAGPNSVDAYVKGMETLIARVREIGARPILFSASPVNDGTTMKNLVGRNVTLDKYAAALRELSQKNAIPYADQFHALVDIWGKNKPRENLIRFADSVQTILRNPILPDADILTQWLNQWRANPLSKQSVDLGGDQIHPGPVGQLTMSCALLKELGAPGLVSRASLDASGRILEMDKCLITNVSAASDGLTFDRLDQCLPMPMPEETYPALTLYPTITDLSQWMLTVKNLPGGVYTVTIDGIKSGIVTADELARGWNMISLTEGPVAAQTKQVLMLIADKEALVAQWRTRSAAAFKNPAEKSALDVLTAQVLEADKKIKEAAQPRMHKFAISPFKP